MSGYTLAELMLVVAIIGVLIAIASRNYEVAIIKTITAEALSVSVGSRLQVHEHYAVTGHWLSKAESQDEEDLTSNQLLFDIQRGAVTVRYPEYRRERLGGTELTLRPVIRGGDGGMALEWLCGYTPAPTGLEAQGPNRTNIPRGHLIGLCRERGHR